MAEVIYRANLKSASFPFLSELFGRSIIVKGPDQNYVTGLAPKESLDTSIGVPQIYYAHNVVPTDDGYRAVGYAEVLAAAYPEDTNFGNVLPLRDADGNGAQIALTPLGNVYILEDGASAWIVPAGAPAAGTIAGKRMTVAFVSGVTYIYFSEVGCYTYDWTTNTLTLVVLAGVTATAILGVVANRGYMLIYSGTEVLWSSSFDATDFVPDLATGAGGGQIEGARGVITTVISVYGGLVVFTTGNGIAGVASDNSRFPYTFVEITNCGGLTDTEFVSADANSSSVYAYTTNGFQRIGLKGAETVFPEVTDFLSGGMLEDFNEITDVLEITNATGVVLQKRIAFIANRYLVISYGLTELTHALFYDSAYKQWGRLKITHADCFEYNRGTVENPKNSVAFITSGGGIYTLGSDILSSAASGVMIVGKFQYMRARLLQLQRVEAENINVGATFSLSDLPAADGKNFGAPLAGYLQASTGKYRQYLFHATAMNHSLLFKGAFNMVSLLLVFNVSGKR